MIFLLPLSSEEGFSLHLLSGSNTCALNCPLATTYIFPFTALEVLSSYMEVKYSVLRVAQKFNVKRRCECLNRLELLISREQYIE